MFSLGTEVTETASATSPQNDVEFTVPRSNLRMTEIEEVDEDEEEEDESELFEIRRVMTPITESLFSFDVNGGGDIVYVAVGKDEASVDALAWALQHAVLDTATFVYLIHVFPVVRYIPTPLGKMPKSQLSPVQVEFYMAQERGKTREFLQKFISMCSSYKVKVDTLLIESDSVAKAIQELIPVLNIRKLVLGTSRSSSRKSKSRRSGSSIADQILQHAPEYCDVKVISEGKEVDMQINDLASLHSSSTPRSKGTSRSSDGDEPNTIFSDGLIGEYAKAGSISCGCFKL